MKTETPDPRDVLLWPDYDWCFQCERSSHPGRGDDFRVVVAGSQEWLDLTFERTVLSTLPPFKAITSPEKR